MPRRRDDSDLDHAFPPLHDLQQVAVTLNVCPRTVENLIRDPAKRFPRPARVGRKRLWVSTDIQTWLAMAVR